MRRNLRRLVLTSVPLGAAVFAVTLIRQTPTSASDGVAHRDESRNGAPAGQSSNVQLALLPEAASTEDGATTEDLRESSPTIESANPARTSGIPPAFAPAYEQLTRERDALYEELNLLTATAYDDAFDRGDYVVTEKPPMEPAREGKLVSHRFHPDGTVWTVVLPREEFEVAYDSRDQVEALSNELRALKRRASRGH